MPKSTREWACFMPLSDLTDLSGRQTRAARGLLGWQRRELAARAGVKIRTVTDFEIGARAPRSATKKAIANALLEGGVELLNGEGVAIRQEPGSGMEPSEAA